MVSEDNDDRANIAQPGGQDIELALKVARDIAADPTKPAAARVQAVRTILEVQQVLGKNAAKPDAGASKPLGQMTRAELEDELARLRADPFGR